MCSAHSIFNSLLGFEFFEVDSETGRVREYNEEGVGTLPDQVLFGMMIGAMNFRHRTPHNDRFSADWEKSLFLYGGKDTVLLDNEERELKDLGYGYNETAEQIGRDITSLLRMTAKRVAKDGKVTQHGADLYFGHLGIALGMMALEVGQHTGLFTIHRKVWNFGDGNQKGRNFNDEIKIYKGGPKKGQLIPEEKLRAYRHIKVPEGTNNKGIANYPKLQEVKRRALEELVKVTKTKMVTYGFEPLQEIAKVSTDIKRTFGNVPKKVITALKNLQKQKWNTSETLDSVVALEGHRDVLEQLMGIVELKGIDRHKSETDSLEAANKDKITDAAMFGASKAAHAHIGSGVSWIHFPEYDYNQNIAKSNEILDAAGFKRDSDGIRFSLRDYWSSGRAFEGRAAQVIRSQLRKVGIDIKIQSFDKPSFVERVFKKRNFDLAHQLFTTSPDPTLSVVHRYHSKNIGRPYANAAGWVNKEYDELSTAEVGIVSVAARAAVWRRVCQILMDELPGYPLFEMPNMQLVRAGFNDVIMDPAGYYGIHEHTYISK